MTSTLLALASDLADTNPAAAQLIVDLDNAETSAEVIDALDLYDVTVSN
jgi:hypothetical protein